MNMDDMFGLNKEFEALNSLANLSELARAVIDLNTKIRHTIHNLDLFRVYYDFEQTINSYNLRN